MNCTLISKAAILLLVLLSWSCQKEAGQSAGSTGHGVGQLAPDIELVTAQGTAKLADFRGKIILLNFWATWCPPCVAEFPTLQELKYKMWGKDFEIVAISVDEGGKPVVDKFLAGRVPNFSLAYDPAGAHAKLFAVSKFPESFVLDRKGKVLRKIVGPQDWISPEMMKYFEQLL